MKRTLRIGTWNIQGIATKTDEVFKEIETNAMDIVALTETKKKGKGTEEKNGYIHIYSGKPKEERASSGVSIVIKKKYRKQIKAWEQITDRILKVEMELKNQPLVIIGVYGPNDDASREKKQEFYNELTRLLDKISNRKEIILLGDLNSRTGWRTDDSVVGPYGENIVNDNGERLIELCQENALRITNGWFKHKDIHRYTWIQPTRNLKTIIDYIIIKQQTRLIVKDVRVMRGLECGSDHHFLIAKIYFPHRQNIDQSTTQEAEEGEKDVRLNLESLNDDSTKFLYQIRLAGKLSSLQDDTAENMYESMKSSIHEAALEALGKKSTYKKNKKAAWWNDNLEPLIKDKKNAYERWLSTKKSEDRITYQNKRKKVQTEVNRAKNEYWERTCQEVNRCIGNTRTNRAWKVIKGMRTQNKDVAGLSLISLKEWKDYYKDLLTEKRAQFSDGEIERQEVEETEVNVTAITSAEIRQSVLQMRNGKAPGPGNINVELMKAAPDILMDVLAIIFNKCLNGCEPPREWKKATITSIFKKGNRQDCKNYRGISVICSVARLYGKVLKGRIEKQFLESEEQNGFRAGRSCIDGIFTLKNLIDKRVERGRAVHLTFIDLHKAYDTVPLNKLWPSMRKNGISKIYVESVKALYCGCSSTVKIGRTVSEEFPITKGLRQGCSLAPLLFKIYLEEVLKSWKRKCHRMGITIGDETLYTLLFADDQVIIAEDADDSNYMLRKLQEEYEKWGLILNTKKTEYMVVGDGERSDLDIETCTIKNCTSFKYLGVTFSSTGKSSEDITNKIGQGRRAIRQLNSLLWSDNITKKNKTAIYKTIVESISTYGSETWELKKRDKDRLMSLEMDFWRRSCRYTRLDHIRNERIREIMGVEGTILDTIEYKQLMWYGHLQRMNDDRWPKKIWQWNPPERKKRGRPPRSWKTDVKEAMEARGLQEGDWIDRNYWKLRSEKRRQS